MGAEMEAPEVFYGSFKIQSKGKLKTLVQLRERNSQNNCII